MVSSVKRPGVVWAYSILVVIGILFVVLGNIQILSNSTNRIVFANDPLSTFGIQYLIAILTMMLIIPQIVFIYQFFMLKRNSLIWLYISFGLGIILNLVSKHWIIAIVIAVFGWAVWDYISHKQLNGNLIFT